MNSVMQVEKVDGVVAKEGHGNVRSTSNGRNRIERIQRPAMPERRLTSVDRSTESGHPFARSLHDLIVGFWLMFNVDALATAEAVCQLRVSASRSLEFNPQTSS
jgi:hypothetical protein